MEWLNRLSPSLLIWNQTWKRKSLQLSLWICFPLHHRLLRSDFHCLSSFSPSAKPDCEQDSVIGLHLRKSYMKWRKHAAKIPSPLTGNERIVFHFAVHSAESQSLWLPAKPPSLLEHILSVTIYKLRTRTCCNKAISCCTHIVKDLMQQSLLSACSQHFSFTVSSSSDTSDSVSWWPRVFERISFKDTDPIAPLT